MNKTSQTSSNHSTPPTSLSPKHIVMYAYSDAQILDITGPLEVFGRTGRWLRDKKMTAGLGYTVEIIGDKPGLLTTSSGMRFMAERSYNDLPDQTDTLFVTGGIGYTAEFENEQFLEWLAANSTKFRRVASICTGALILAKAGLLTDRQATTHWAYCEALASENPKTEVIPDALYVKDGRYYTSAGVTAGMDLALAMVEEDWGAGVALAIAQELVLFLKRPGGQSQFSRQLESQKLETDDMRSLTSWMINQLDKNLTVPVLAARASMSERHFARRFTSEIGATPARYVETLRVEQARLKLEETKLPMKIIAADCGFSSPEIMRRAFQRTVGVPPAGYRSRFSAHP